MPKYTALVVQGVRVHPSLARFRTSGRRRAPAVAALLTAVALVAGGCSSSDSSSPAATPGGSGTATGDAPPMATKVVLGTVAGNVHQPYRQRFAAARPGLEKSVGQAVDAWLDGGFVGVSYPRDSFATAFTSFTPDARKDAEHDRDLMTLWGYRHQIDGVTTTHRKVVVDVLAPRGKPAGATARIDLRFTTTGEVKKPIEVSGRLFLTPTADGSWRIFGYDVAKGVRG
jgi:hypothetical protein